MADVEFDDKGNVVRKKEASVNEPPVKIPPATPTLNPDFPKTTSAKSSTATNVNNMPAATPSARDVAILTESENKRNAGAEPDVKITASSKDPAKLQKIESVLKDGGMDSASVIRSLQRIDEILWPAVPVEPTINTPNKTVEDRLKETK